MNTALVTGGSQGIGLAVVERFVADGLFVHATYNRSQAAAEQITARLGAERVAFHALDLADENAIDRLAGALGELDVLVNNAGLGSATVRRAAADERAQDALLMRVNALGPMWLTRALLPRLQARPRAVVINISSVGGGVFHFPGFRWADGASKAALAFWSRQLAAELSQSPVDVFTVCPGATDTGMFQASTLDGMTAAERAAFEQRLPKGRLIAPEEIAALCAQLLAPESRVLHGATLDASSGLGVAPWQVVGQ